MKNQNHTSYFTHRTSQKGITLIALIITIIVMLILVGVTINVALNGELFQKVETATRETEEKAILEEMLAMMEIDNNGKFIPDRIIANMRAKHPEYTISYNKPNASITGKLGTYNYIVSETEIKIGTKGNIPEAFNWENVNLGNVDTSTAYKGYIGTPANMTVIGSFTEDGKVIMEINGVITEINAKDPDNIDEATGNLSFSLEIVSGTSSNIVVTMNDNDPNVYANIEGLGTITYEKQGKKTIYSNEEVLKMLGVSNSTGTYTGTWKVLESDGDGNPTKLVSTSNVTMCTLGEKNNVEKTISDYKTAVSTLNTAAEKATGITLETTGGITSARSINVEDIETLAGIQDSDKGDNYNKPYTYNYTNSKDQIFVTESGDTVKIDSEGKEVILKHTYYSKKLSSDDIGTLASGKYWLASPCVLCNGSVRTDFCVYFMDSAYLNNGILFSSAGNMGGSISIGVRAVVSI